MFVRRKHSHKTNRLIFYQNPIHMKRLLLTTTLLLSISLSGFTQTKQENIKELLKAMQIEKTMATFYDSIIPMMTAQMKSRRVSTDSSRSKKPEEMMQKITEASRAMTKSFMENEISGIYDRNYNDLEIKDLLAFYQTPTGKKMVENQPIIQKETMQIMMSKYLPDFQAKIKTMMEETMPAKTDKDKN
jgi:uncharacterized protein